MSTDSIQIIGLRLYGYTGVLPEEQTLGQWYEVDVVIWLDVSQAGQSDRLQDTYDYRADIQAIRELVKTARFNLIERLATAIADILLASNRVDQVLVRLSKVSPPIPDFNGRISVEITRKRAEKVN